MIGIYERFSREEKKKKMSLEFQEETCRGFLKREGLDGGIRVYEDKAVSGKTFARPEFQRLVKDIESGVVNTVVVYRYDRLGRNSLEAQLRIEAFKKLGVKCFSATEGNGTLLRNVLLAVAQQESEDIGARTRDGLRTLAKRGFWCGGKVYGYNLFEHDEHTVLRIDAEEAEVVRRIYRAYASGMGHRAIAAMLNREGIPGPRTFGWSFNVIGSVLRNCLYVGTIEYGKRTYERDCVTGKRKAKYNDPSQIIRVERPELRIIDKKLASQVQAVMNEKRRIYKRRGRGGVRVQKYMLSGLVTCGVCDGGRYTKWGKYLRCNHNVRYAGKCSNGHKVNVAKLEEALVTSIEQNLLTPKRMEEAADIIEQELGSAVDEVEAAKKRLTTVEGKLRRLISALETGRKRPESIMGRIDELEAEKARLVVLIKEAKGRKPQKWTRKTIIQAIKKRLGKTSLLYQRVRQKGDEAAAEFAEVVRKIVKGLVVFPDGRIRVKADPLGALPRTKSCTVT